MNAEGSRVLPPSNLVGRRLVALAVLLSVLAASCTPNAGSAESTNPSTESTVGSVDTADSTLPPMEILMTMVEPIYGYGDYSLYLYADVPWDLFTAAQIRCLHDQGFPVDPDGDTGMTFDRVPLEQNQALQIAWARCTAGLNPPDIEGTSPASIEEVYRFWVDVLAPCYEAKGFSIPDPPSLETFIETYPNVEWTPWRFVPHTPELDQKCSSDPYDHDLQKTRIRARAAPGSGRGGRQ